MRELLRHCLTSVAKASEGLEVETIVVDNNSADGSVEMIASEFSSVKCIANLENVGFGAANNQALAVATGRYYLILNPDTILGEDSLTALLAFAHDKPGAGAIGCKILHPDGTFAPESRRSFPTPRVAFYRISGLSKLFPRSPRFGRYNMTYLDEDVETEVDALSGSCMLIRADAVDSLGNDGKLFDEDFFMYGEDLDACFRLQQKGWQIWYTPKTQIIHFKGESTKKGELRYVKLFYGAMLLFAEKHFNSTHSLGMRMALRASIFGRGVLSAASTLLRRGKAGVSDFILMYGVSALVGTSRSLWIGTEPNTLIYTVVALLYGLGTVTAIRVAGGYRRLGLHRLTPPIIGVVFGALFVAAVSFFYKDIGFSRLSVALAVPIGWIVLLIPRLLRYKNQQADRAVFVGTEEEAKSLEATFGSPFANPTSLVGFVLPNADTEANKNDAFLGYVRQLRDVVRLNAIDTAIFSSSSLSNEDIFAAMRGMADLQVESKILAGGADRIIGKASIDPIVQPTYVSAESAIGHVRSRSSKRLFDVLMSVFLVLLFPVRWLIASIGGAPARSVVKNQTAGFVRVIKNELALLGYCPERANPPESWGLRPAVLSLVDTLPPALREEDGGSEIRKALWHYSTHQSTLYDLFILWQVVGGRVRID